MVSVVSVLDNYTPLQKGDNMHKEYTWSNSIQERILQLSYQLTRTNEETILNKISKEYGKLLNEIFYNKNSSEETNKFKGYLIALIPYVRDIISGKGEYNLNYNLISTLAYVIDENKATSSYELTYYMEQLLFLVIKCNINLEGYDHPCGSWKDMKYLLNHLWYIFGETKLKKMSIFSFIIGLYCDQLRIDDYSENPSLCARWVPREKSRKFGWITKYIACMYYEHFRKYEMNDEIIGSKSLSVRKCLTHFRQLISNINKKLKTPQINFCDRNWKSIDFNNNVTSITLSKMRKAFQYVNEDNNIIDETNEDRMTCRNNYLMYLEQCDNGKKKIKNARVGIVDMVKEAIKLGKLRNCQDINVEENSKLEKSLNLQWKEAGKQIKNMDKFIAMVDTSRSMTGDPINAAVGLGIRIAEKSSIGKRVMTFSAYPQWINLDDKEGLVDMATYIETNSSWEMNTNFASAAKLILDACIEKDLTPDEVEGMVLVILSDMQIEKADHNANSIDDLLNKMFEEGGKRTTHKKPYKKPRILFWNLRSTGGFPALSITENVGMISGFSPVLLNNFSKQGLSALNEYTPWCILIEQLTCDRYEHVWKAVENTI